jgi:hypothetical protein
MVPESHHPITFGLDHRRAIRIGLYRMLPAIDLDHHPGPVAGEIDDEVAERNLPAPASFGRDTAQ